MAELFSEYNDLLISKVAAPLVAVSPSSGFAVPNAAYGAITTANLGSGNLANVVLNSAQIGGNSNFYQVNNNGIFNFGDASDGNVIISSNTTLTADKYYNNLTVNASITLTSAGFRIFVQDTCIVNGIIAWNGNNGGNGNNSISQTGATGGGAGGAALADGFLKGSVAGTDGGNGANGGNSPNSTGGNGTASTGGNGASNSLGVNGVQGGSAIDGLGGGGGGGLGGTGGGAGAVGVATAANVKLIANWHVLTFLDVNTDGTLGKMTPGAGSSGGGGGAGGGGGSTGAGGGGGKGGGAGSGGGMVAIIAKRLIVNSGGVLRSNGGNGGNGGNGSGGSGNGGGGSGGGGGAGGDGGTIVYVYNDLVNNGTIQVNGGTGGTGGTRGGDANTSNSGTAGAAGKTYSIQLSI